MKLFEKAGIILLLLIGVGFPSLDAKLWVCATTSLVADLVGEIGGDYVEIQSLMGPGVDPHLYKAKASDIKKMMRADVIFYNGLHLEGRMDELLGSLRKEGRSAHAISLNISEDQLIGLNGSEHKDPHIWFDPRLWAKCALYVGEVLAEKAPEHSDFFRQRGQDYSKKLLELHEWGLSYAKELADAKRVLITSHDAYNYFGKAFKFEVIGVQGVSTVSEAGLADVMSTVDFIKKRQVKAIFVESSVSPAAIARISKDSGVNIGGELFSDAIGGKGVVETLGGAVDPSTYVGMFKYNFYTIVEALK